VQNRNPVQAALLLDSPFAGMAGWGLKGALSNCRIDIFSSALQVHRVPQNGINVKGLRCGCRSEKAIT